jgi:hypothetical protein
MIAPAELIGRRIRYNSTADEALFLALAGGGPNTLYVIVLKDDGTISEWAADRCTILGPVSEPYR